MSRAASHREINSCCFHDTPSTGYCWLYVPAGRREGAFHGILMTLCPSKQVVWKEPSTGYCWPYVSAGRGEEAFHGILLTLYPSRSLGRSLPRDVADLVSQQVVGKEPSTGYSWPYVPAGRGESASMKCNVLRIDITSVNMKTHIAGSFFLTFFDMLQLFVIY